MEEYKCTPFMREAAVLDRFFRSSSEYSRSRTGTNFLCRRNTRHSEQTASLVFDGGRASTTCSVFNGRTSFAVGKTSIQNNLPLVVVAATIAHSIRIRRRESGPRPALSSPFLDLSFFHRPTNPSGDDSSRSSLSSIRFAVQSLKYSIAARRLQH